MYQKKVSRAEPALIPMLLDDSGSEEIPLPGTTDPKYAWVERLSGVVFKDLLARSTELKDGVAIIKPRFYLWTLKYGSDTELWGDGEMDIEAAVTRYAQDGNSLKLGACLRGTDTATAFQEAFTYLRQAVDDPRFHQSFPPMLFHLTDGESATDAGPIAEQIKQLATADGNVLIVNVYIGTQTNLNYRGPEDFPGYVDLADVGPNPDNQRLFQMSSIAPPCICQNLIEDGIFPSLRDGARLFFDVRTKDMLKHAIQVVGSVGSRAARNER